MTTEPQLAIDLATTRAELAMLRVEYMKFAAETVAALGATTEALGLLQRGGVVVIRDDGTLAAMLSVNANGGGGMLSLRGPDGAEGACLYVAADGTGRLLLGDKDGERHIVSPVSLAKLGAGA